MTCSHPEKDSLRYGDEMGGAQSDPWVRLRGPD
jgi:hypothetical protein